MPIQVLPPAVSSRIAAGEVVERPASVVKELVENSLDARATDISVEIRAGGIESIRVVDNGEGVPADQAGLAFERFATSKLTQADDLESVATLGFRGEALPSIAAVSTVTLVTKAASDDYGTRVEVADGKAPSSQRQGAPPGTSLTVRDLFRHFPARRKFLRRPATEASQVQALTTRYALAYPGVRFRLEIDGSAAFATPGNGALREAVSAVYGEQTATAMLDIESKDGDETDRDMMAGMVGAPSINRANRSRISLFVNGRWIQDRALGHALEESYRGFLMERRFPVAVVYISVPYDSVDVNVHPSKTEVRFLRQGQVYRALQNAVRETLIAHSPVPEIGTSQVAVAPPGPHRGWGHSRTQGLDAAEHFRLEGPAGGGQHAATALHPASDEAAYPESIIPREALPVLRVLGQVQSTYIAAEGPDGVYLIDQHAAHERVLFEQVKARALSNPAEAQSLMTPVTVDLDPRLAEAAESHKELIENLGFVVEPFGDRAYLLRGVPSLISEGDPAQSLTEFLELMVEGGGFESWEERAAYSVACHAAVRAGKVLSEAEMSELTHQLEGCEQPHTCPHGRPTMVHLSSARLEQEFGRR